MNRADRAAHVAQLHAQGLNGIQIAEQLGISRSYAYELINDPQGGGVVARKNRYRQPCIDCGTLTNGSDGHRDEPRCPPCAATKAGAARVIWTREKIVERIQAWAVIYGEPPASMDWNPTDARNRLRDEQRAARWEAGSWPWFTCVYRVYGTWNEAIRAAGFEPRQPNGGGGNIDRRRDRRPIAA